ncbi:MAG: efflux RND transporter periplasmic adaptor subunit [Bacteroidia bacterium]
MKKIFYFFIIVFIYSCKSEIVKIKPIISPITESVYASGSLKSNQQYQAFATVNGIIQTIFVKEGDSVNIGTPILSIVNDLQKLNSENAALASDYNNISSNQDKLNDAQQVIYLQKSKMENDELLFARQKNLWKDSIGTKVELEQREIATQNSKIQYQSAITKYNDLKRQINFIASQANKNLQITQRQSSDFIVKSQVNGMVYKLFKDEGEAVNIQTPLALLGNRNDFILEMQVDEFDIIKIKKGLPVLVLMDSYKGQVFEAEISVISPIMNERSKTFLVKATFNEPPKILYPFISFEANIIIQTKQNALLIPRNLLLNDSTVIKANGDKAIIKVGLKDYQMVEVLSGISVNDELISPIK